MIIEETGVILTPGNHGKDCAGADICCDACKYILCCVDLCYPICCWNCENKECPRPNLANKAGMKT